MKKGIKDRVAIMGTGVTKFGELWEKDEEDLLVEAVYEACDSAHVDLQEDVEGVEGPFISASDYVRALGEQIRPWIPGAYHVLGTDGMGRSETREALRRHFEVDAECIAIASMYQLSRAGKVEMAEVAKAIKSLGDETEKAFSLYA